MTPATIIPPMVIVLSIVIWMAPTTLPTALLRFLATLEATLTRPMVITRSLATQPAATTLDWAIMPEAFLPLVVTTSLLGTLVWPAREMPFASAQNQSTRTCLSPVLTAYLCL